MPAIAHIGVGFAAKRIAPAIYVISLIIAAELVEIVFFVSVAQGLKICLWLTMHHFLLTPIVLLWESSGQQQQLYLHS